MLGLFALVLIVYSAIPIINVFIGESIKDNQIWFDTGQQILRGEPIYPGPNEKFPFMYPPTAALLLAPVSLLGRAGLVIALVLLNAARVVRQHSPLGAAGDRQLETPASPALRHTERAHQRLRVEQFPSRSAQPAPARAHARRVRRTPGETRLAGRRIVRARGGDQSLPGRRPGLPALPPFLARGRRRSFSSSAFCSSRCPRRSEVGRRRAPIWNAGPTACF